jgi:hypothetical protein
MRKQHILLLEIKHHWLLIMGVNTPAAREERLTATAPTVLMTLKVTVSARLNIPERLLPPAPAGSYGVGQ